MCKLTLSISTIQGLYFGIKFHADCKKKTIKNFIVDFANEYMFVRRLWEMAFVLISLFVQVIQCRSGLIYGQG